MSDEEDDSWLATILDTGHRRVLLHLRQFDSISDSEVAEMLGSARAARKFGAALEGYRLPFDVRVEPSESGKVYVCIHRWTGGLTRDPDRWLLPAGTDATSEPPLEAFMEVARAAIMASMVQQISEMRLALEQALQTAVNAERDRDVAVSACERLRVQVVELDSVPDRTQAKIAALQAKLDASQAEAKHWRSLPARGWTHASTAAQVPAAPAICAADPDIAEWRSKAQEAKARCEALERARSSERARWTAIRDGLERSRVRLERDLSAMTEALAESREQERVATRLLERDLSAAKQALADSREHGRITTKLLDDSERKRVAQQDALSRANASKEEVKKALSLTVARNDDVVADRNRFALAQSEALRALERLQARLAQERVDSSNEISLLKTEKKQLTTAAEEARRQLAAYGPRAAAIGVLGVIVAFGVGASGTATIFALVLR